MRKILAALFLTAFSSAVFADSPDMQSDWLEPVEGERCETSGAEIMEVQIHPETGNHSLVVKLPKSRVSSEATMEEVRVVGQAPEKMELPELFPELETEWVDDYDNDHYGLLVRFKSDQKTPIRLFMSSEAGFFDGSVQP